MKNLRFFLGLLGFIIMSQPLTAQKGELLWAVSGNGLTTSSYIFGTMHILCDDQVGKNPQLQAAFSQTKALVLELNMDQPEIMLEVQQLSMNPNNENVYKRLPKEEYKALDAFLIKQIGTGLNQLGVLKPFALTSLISMAFLPCETHYSVEEALTKQAVQEKKTVMGLETAKLQMSLFDSIPLNLQLQELIRQVSGEEGSKEFLSLLDAYSEGKLSRLQQLFTENHLMTKYQSLLLDQRNLAWIPILEVQFAQAPTFVAVGAGHLVGEKGLLSLLKAKGYTLTMVNL